MSPTSALQAKVLTEFHLKLLLKQYSTDPLQALVDPTLARTG